MKKLHPKYLNGLFPMCKTFGWIFPKAHDELSGNSVNLGLLGSSESSNSWPSTFFWREKLAGKLCWKKAVEDMRQLGTTGTHHPHIILSCKTLCGSLAKMPSICVGNLFEDVTLQCFMVGRSSPENLGQAAKKSEKPLVSKTAKV